MCRHLKVKDQGQARLKGSRSNNEHMYKIPRVWQQGNPWFYAYGFSVGGGHNCATPDFGRRTAPFSRSCYKQEPRLRIV